MVRGWRFSLWVEYADMSGDTAEKGGDSSAAKSLILALAVVADGGMRPASVIAAELGFPSSSARRFLALLTRTHVLMRLANGHYAAGVALEAIADQVSANARLGAAAKAPLRRLARATRATAHLGVLEGDMVTYLAKESGDPQFQETKAGTQLEAYCTGIGKMLLAALPEKDRRDFLGNGPFVPITIHTHTDPKLLLAELQDSAGRDFALDEGEMFEDVRCIAVPVRRNGSVVAAVSLSRKQGTMSEAQRQRDLVRLRACAKEIVEALG